MAARKTTGSVSASPKTPTASKAAPAKAPAGRTGRTPTKKATASKAPSGASPTAKTTTPTDKPITAVVHDQQTNACGKQFKPSDGILIRLNEGTWEDRGIDCPYCVAYRPLSDYSMVRA